MSDALATKVMDLGSSTVTITSSDPADAYFAHGFDEVPTAVSVARAVLASDAVVVDVGANIGVCTAAYGRLAPDGVVHAFEPGTRAARDLRSTVAANGLTNVACHEVALGEADGSATLLVPTWNTTGAFIADDSAVTGIHAGNEQVSSVEVEVRALDSVVDELGLDRLDLLKIDVEGHEDAVLAGAARTLERLRPVTLVEFNVFTLSVFAGRNPLEFLVDMTRLFPHVLAMDQTGAVEPVSALAGMFGITHRCFTHDRVIDLVCSWDVIDPEVLGTVGMVSTTRPY